MLLLANAVDLSGHQPTPPFIFLGFFFFTLGIVAAGFFGMKKWAEDKGKVSSLLFGRYKFVGLVASKWPLILMLAGALFLFIGAQQENSRWSCSQNSSAETQSEESSMTNDIHIPE